VRRALALACLACACSRPPPRAPFTLRVGVTAPLGWEGPRTGSGGAVPATDLVFQGVLQPAGGKVASLFLRRWERTSEGRWRLEFQPGQRFSDGRPVGAEDVARSLRSSGFQVERDGDVLLATSPPGTGGLAGLLLTSVASGDGPDALGTGPFAVAERSPGRLVLRRLERRPGRIDAVEMVGFASTREAFAHLIRGQVNAVFPLERAQAELLDGVPGVRILSGRAPNAIVAFLHPRRLSREERRRLADALPLGDVAALAGLGAHCQGAPARGAVPEGRPLRIGHVRLWEENARTALALRRVLGTRGGEVFEVEEGRIPESAPDLDLLVIPALVWPPAMLAVTLAKGARFNWLGYANEAFDAAVRAGDEEAASAALRADPPMLVVCRRERLLAVDARVRNPTLADWGSFDTLPEWEVSP